jgi:sugar lactone lactonase YvrE
MNAYAFDTTRCQLGEGPLWHPLRGQLYWFDITGRRLLTREAGATRSWDLPEITSAAGWIDAGTLLTVSESGFDRFDLATGTRERLADLEAEIPGTRSNDGRADPMGGFWVGTMGKNAEPRAGARNRYYKGEVRCLWPEQNIPNAICFSPDGLHAYYADTARGRVWRFDLDADGWPRGEPAVFLDLRAEALNPDGAVTDAAGHFWNAQWGAHRVAEYDTAGRFLRAIDVPPAHSSCPAFGGPDLTTLYVTSAMQGLDRARLDAEPAHGQTFAVDGVAQGRPEPQVQP